LITNLRQNPDIPTQLHRKGQEEVRPNEAATSAFTNQIKLNRAIKIKHLMQPRKHQEIQIQLQMKNQCLKKQFQAITMRGKLYHRVEKEMKEIS
jgi:hypothetical protein|tara:strand:- start:2804 stop:3085 length:282 start_codon:yes stop_codon:yes gene_type:complete